MKSMIAISGLVLLALSACTWVEPTDQAVNVKVAYMSEVSNCKPLGKVTVGVLDKVMFIPRSADQVAGELEISAQNAAIDLAGDTVVAISRVVDGSQTFRVYRCRL